MTHRCASSQCGMHEQVANEVQQSWLSAHTHTLLSKLKVIEQQLLALTYTSDTMPALRRVDDHLTRAQRKLDARDKQVSCVLHSDCVNTTSVA